MGNRVCLFVCSPLFCGCHSIQPSRFANHHRRSSVVQREHVDALLSLGNSPSAKSDVRLAAVRIVGACQQACNVASTFLSLARSLHLLNVLHGSSSFVAILYFTRCPLYAAGGMPCGILPYRRWHPSCEGPLYARLTLHGSRCCGLLPLCAVPRHATPEYPHRCGCAPSPSVSHTPLLLARNPPQCRLSPTVYR